MENVLPENVAAALTAPGDGRKIRRHGLVAVSNGRSFPVREISDNGIVVEADAAHGLRGTVDILRAGERIARHLVQFAWAKDGLAAYEFKRGGRAGQVSPDHVPPAHAGLLGGPSD
jgi:hypothetical protein